MSENKMKIHLVDAKGKVLGRLATQVANILRGKNKSTFVYNQPIGDKVVVINAKNIRFTGRKLEQKRYIHHTGYPGGLKEKSLDELFKSNPSEVIKTAVCGMLPKNKLRKSWLKNLKIYLGKKENDQ